MPPNAISFMNSYVLIGTPYQTPVSDGVPVSSLLFYQASAFPFISYCVVQGGRDLKNVSPRNWALATSQSSVMADPLYHFGCPVSEFGELLQLFLISSPLVDRIFENTPYFYGEAGDV